MAERSSDRIALESAGRLEAFSDGVFAIAITLLILEIKVPVETEGVLLTDQLLALWPSYLAFLTSFATIGIMWINHHGLFRHMQSADHWLMVINLLLLLGVTFVPFPTALLAEHITKSDANIAAMFYSGTFVYIALTFNLLHAYASRAKLLESAQVAPEYNRNLTLIYSATLGLYVIGFVVSYFNALIGFGIMIVLALFYALPPRRIPGVE